MAKNRKKGSQKSKDETQSAPPEAFPKIVVEAKLIALNKKVNTADPKFEGLNMTGGQFEQFSRWIDGGDRIRITFEQTQATMPAGEEPAAEEPDMFKDDNPDTEAGDR
ncbi:MAG: hypothetical protein PHH26_00550 [Candidatus Thermoplasmatota archaeon]|nr:hypothetical protein [Candidatus Thermoplasmatota archaeon]